MSVQKNEKDKKQRSISIINTIFLYISTVSIFNVILLSIEYFYPLISVFGSLILLFLVFIVFKIRVVRERGVFSLLFLVIILLAIFFRISPNLYLTGGQDQGSYVSLSKQYEINHSLYIKDELRESLSDVTKRIYDKGNVFTGLKPYDKDNSEYIIPFYPVFPSWMSIFGSFFGSDNRIYALTMFSLLSIVSVYLFSYEISNRNKKVALITSFFLAINPLHVYFSKTPVTEVISITFLFYALYLIVKFFNDSKSNKYFVSYLVLSIISFVSLFLTRMSAIFFLPLIILLPIISNLFLEDKKQSIYYLIYSFSWIILFLLSYFYYYLSLPQIFDLIVGKRLLGYVNIETISISLFSIPVLVYILLKFDRSRFFLKNIIIFFKKNLYILSILTFLG